MFHKYKCKCKRLFKSFKMKLVNQTVCAQLNCRLNLKHIARTTKDVECSRKISAVIIRLRKPKSTAMIFQNGKITVTGTTSLFDAKKAMRRFARKIQKCGYDVKISNFNINNKVYSIDSKIKVDLRNLQNVIRKKSSFEPELFGGLIYKSEYGGATIYQSGKINIYGITKISNANKVRDEMYSFILESQLL